MSTSTKDKDLPRGTGSFSAKTTHWDPSDPKSHFNATAVSLFDAATLKHYSLLAFQEQADHFVSVRLDIPHGLQSGEHGMGSAGVRGVINLPGSGSGDVYVVQSGLIKLDVHEEGKHYSASELRFEARHPDGTLVELYLGKFDILK